MEIEGAIVTDVTIRNDGIIPAALDAAGRLLVSPLDTHFIMDGKLDGTAFQLPLSGGFPLLGILNPTSKTFALQGSLKADTGDSVAFVLDGLITRQPPAAIIGGNQVAECVQGKSRITLDSSASYDLDGDLASRAWFLVGQDGRRERIGTLTRLEHDLPLGTHTIELEVRDSHLQINRARVTVQVVDTRPPTLQAAFKNMSCVWPPNGKWLEFAFGNHIVASAKDDCDGEALQPIIVGVNPHQVSGETVATVRADGQAVCVQARREGHSAGRWYLVEIEAVDSSGNAARASLSVVVPHDQRAHPDCRRADSMGGCL
ncbi:MAG: hypothetical protein HYZ28_18875 [Myxococcales bacterium]|nr:hypothetical protein [Myxococcales bacterium]